MSGNSRPFSNALRLAALAALLSGCALTRRERAVVNAWLTCEDCTAGEADSVRAIGRRWVRWLPLTLALRGDVVSGPSVSDRRNVTAQLHATFAADSQYALRHPSPSPLTSGGYVAHYLGNYVATYRVRAAVALAGVAGRRLLPRVDTSADSTVVPVVVMRLRSGGGHP